MFQKLEVNKFEGLYSSVAPEIIKDGQARDIFNFRMEKVGKLVTRNGYIIGLFTTVAPTNSNEVNNAAYAGNGGIIGLGELILDKPWTTLPSGQALNADRFMVYAIRAEVVGNITAPDKYSLNGVAPKRNYLAYLFSPLNGPLANTLIVNDDIEASYMSGISADFHHFIDKTPQSKPMTTQEFNMLFAPNKSLPVYGNGDNSTGQFQFDEWIDQYIQMSQYRHQLVISDRINGDAIIEDEGIRDSDRKLVGTTWQDPAHGLHIRPNALETFDINKVNIDLRTNSGEENAQVTTGMALYKYVLPKKHLIMSTNNKSSDLSDPTTYIDGGAESRDDNESLINRNFRNSQVKFAMSYLTDEGGPDWTLDTFGFKYNNEVKVFSNAESTNEYDDIIGKIELDDIEYEDEKGNLKKTKVSDVYLWKDYQIPYTPSQAIDGQGKLLTDAARLFENTSTNARVKELHAIDPLGRTVPLSVWQYRFVWDFGDGVYSAPSALLQAPDIIFSAITDTEMAQLTNTMKNPTTAGLASDGYIKERAKYWYPNNLTTVLNAPNNYGSICDLFHTQIIATQYTLDPNTGNALSANCKVSPALGYKLFDLKQKVYGTQQNKFGVQTGTLDKNTGIVVERGTPWGFTEYADFACYISVSPVPDIVETKGVFWEGAGINIADSGWGDGKQSRWLWWNLENDDESLMASIDDKERYVSVNNGALKIPVFMNEESRSLTYYSLFDNNGSYRVAWRGNQSLPANNYDVGSVIVFPGFNIQAIMCIDTPFNCKYDKPIAGFTPQAKLFDYIYHAGLTVPEMIYSKSNLNTLSGNVFREDDCYLHVVPKQIIDADDSFSVPVVISINMQTAIELPVVGAIHSYRFLTPSGALDTMLIKATAHQGLPLSPGSRKIPYKINVPVSSIGINSIEPWLMDETFEIDMTSTTFNVGYYENGTLIDRIDSTDPRIANGIDVAKISKSIADMIADISKKVTAGRKQRFAPALQDEGLRPATLIRASKISTDSFNNYSSDVDVEAAQRLILNGTFDAYPLKYTDYFAVRSEINTLDATDIRKKWSKREASKQPLRAKLAAGTSHAYDAPVFYKSQVFEGDEHFVADGQVPDGYARTNLDVHCYLPASRFIGVEQLTSYFPASQLFLAPRVGLHIEPTDVPRRAKALLIFRTIATHSNDYDPASFGLVDRLEIERDNFGNPITYKPDQDPNNQGQANPGVYYFDDVRDQDVDFSDNPDNYDGLRKALFSRFNIAINERMYYGNFTEVYQSLPPRGMVSLANFDTNVNYKLVPAPTNVAPSDVYKYYLVYMNEDDKLSPAVALGNSINPTDSNGTNAVVWYYIPHKYDQTIKETRVYREKNNDGNLFLIGRVEDNELGIFVDNFSYIGSRIDCTEPTKINYESGVRWSEPFTPDKIKLNNFAEVGSGDGDQITGLTTLAGNLVVFKENSIWRCAIQGDDPPISRTDLVVPDIGCIAPGAIATVNNVIYFLSWDGLKQFDNNTANNVDTPFSEELGLLLRALPKAKVRDAQMGYNSATSELYLNIPSLGLDQYKDIQVPPDVATTAVIMNDHSENTGVTTTTPVPVISDYYRIDISPDIDNTGGYNVEHRETRYGHIFILDLKKGYATKFGYPATRKLDRTNRDLDILTTDPVQLLRMYYTNSFGEMRSADISPKLYMANYDTANAKLDGSSFKWAGLYIESPYMSRKPLPIITGQLGNLTCNNLNLSSLLYQGHDEAPVQRYRANTVFPIAQYIPVRTVFKSKFFTGETEFTLKRIRKVLTNIFAKDNFRVDGIAFHYEGYDSRIDPNSPRLAPALQTYYYPPTDHSVDYHSLQVTQGSGRNIVTFVPSSNGTDWYGKPVKFAIDVYSEQRTQINALELFWRPIHTYLL